MSGAPNTQFVDPALAAFIDKNCNPKTMLINRDTREPLNVVHLRLHENHWAQELMAAKKTLKAGMTIMIEPLHIYGYYTLKPGFSLTEASFLPIRLNFYSWNTESQMKLDARARIISLNRIGHLGVSKPRYISADRLARYVKYAVAEAILGNIAHTEEGLCARDFIPTVDFLDIAYERIRSDVCFQIIPQEWSIIYQTGRNSNNDSKVYFLYGVKNLSTNKTHMTGIQIRIGNIKTIELQDMSQIDEYGSMFFQRPILFRRCDDMVVLMRGNGEIEKLKLLGFVVETIGDHIVN